MLKKMQKSNFESFHLGFDWKWILTISLFLWTDDATTHPHIKLQQNWSYCNLTIFNLIAICHLEFDRK